MIIIQICQKTRGLLTFWILYNLFNEDEATIGDKIIDYNDMGVDAYEIYEDTNDIYLIQNKYYSDGNMIDTSYVQNDFLLRAITALENGTYLHCPTLQKFFTKAKSKSDFMVHLQLYVTNNNRNRVAEDAIHKWNMDHPRYHAEIFYLDDIQNKFFNDEVKTRLNWNCRIVTKNSHTILTIRPDEYKLKNVKAARYVFMPVQAVYELYKKARVDGYPIFDENIREYLGNKGVNKQIYQTLMDPNERCNFFYYNNGITIICDSMEKIETGVVAPGMCSSFVVHNPQIVNGCQTVNSIYQALDNVDDTQLQQEFDDTFVMVKVLAIDKSSVSDTELYRKIVKYNNSQNAIDEKTFVKNAQHFTRVQAFFKEHGFLVMLKQSDKNQFTEKYGGQSADALQFRQLSNDILARFGLSEDVRKKLQLVDLSKLLQVILAFKDSGHHAYQRKAYVLKPSSVDYKLVTEFIQNNDMETLLYLWCFYLRLEEARNLSVDKRNPVIYYALDLFGQRICNGRDSSLIKTYLCDSNWIDEYVKKIESVTRAYIRQKQKMDHDLDYNHLIKLGIDYSVLDNCYELVFEML